VIYRFVVVNLTFDSSHLSLFICFKIFPLRVQIQCVQKMFVCRTQVAHHVRHPLPDPVQSGPRHSAALRVLLAGLAPLPPRHHRPRGATLFVLLDPAGVAALASHGRSQRTSHQGTGEGGSSQQTAQRDGPRRRRPAHAEEAPEPGERQRPRPRPHAHHAHLHRLHRLQLVRLRAVLLRGAQYIGQLGGNIFINVALSAVIQIPSSFFAIWALKSWGRKRTLVFSNLVAGGSCLLIGVVPPEAAWIRSALSCADMFALAICFVTCYIFSGELFPTVVRNVGVGTASMFARLGSMAAPFVAGLVLVEAWLPPIIFGVVPLIGAVLCFLLPETLNCKLPDTVEEAESIALKKPETEEKK
jgi:hypothetical protein